MTMTQPPKDRIRRSAKEIIKVEELDERFDRAEKLGQPLRVKLGMDPTAPDIHLGHSIPLRVLRAFQDLGHKAVLIIGNGTAKVGDPSGQNKTRPMLTDAQIEANLQTYFAQASLILDEDPDRLEIVRNGDWFEPMRFDETLRLMGRFTVAQMIERDTFEQRLKNNQPVGLHELMYPIMQGWDSVQVRADVELGGTDQKFNLVTGRQLQREQGQAPQVCVITPLLVGTDGTGNKMAKSLGNSIGISESPREKFGKTMSIPDERMQMWFELLTDLAAAQIRQLLAGNPREAKDRLAREIVAQFHGHEAAIAESEWFRAHFGKDARVPPDVPELTVPADVLAEDKIWIVKLLSLAGHAQSNGEARRLISGGGVSLDGKKIEDAAAQVAINSGMVLKTGKRRFARIVVAETAHNKHEQGPSR